MFRSPRFLFFVAGVAMAGVVTFLLIRPGGIRKAAPNGDGASSGQSVRRGDQQSPVGTVASDHQPALSTTTIATESVVRRAAADRDLLSPENDGWTSEHYAELAGKKLKELLGQLDSTAGQKTINGVPKQKVAVTELRPDQLVDVFADSSVTVNKWEPQRPLQVTNVDGHALLERIRRSVPFERLEDFHFHVKVVSVEIAPNEDAVSTHALIEFSNSQKGRSWQSNAAWDCEWNCSQNGVITLAAIRLAAYQESEVKVSEEGKWFTDRTKLVAGHNVELATQLRHGHHYWLQRIERSHRFDTSVRNGLAIGDANGDGLDDVYVCQPPGLPNLLLIHQPDGSATNRAAESGVDWLDQTSSAIFADLDNDGDQDLVIGTPIETLLMANDGAGHFSLHSTLKHDYDVQSVSVVDYDNDGLLDVFVCLYRTEKPSANQYFLYRDAVGGGQNRLFRNTMKDGILTYQDVTFEVGLDDGGDRYTLAASWEDFDNDGDQDLYVANDFGKNFLYRNDKGHFTNIAPQAGVEDIGSGMSVGWGDFNRDGFVDLYVGNMFSSAGNRVTSQPEFRADEDAVTRAIYRRLAKGNSLFQNRGDGTFEEVGAGAGVELGRWAWSSLFADLNNDGWDDLFVANGYITTPDSGDL